MKIQPIPTTSGRWLQCHWTSAVASGLSNRQNCACARKTVQTQPGRTHGAGCVRQWFRTAEPLGERRYENWNTHTQLSNSVVDDCLDNNHCGWKRGLNNCNFLSNILLLMNYESSAEHWNNLVTDCFFQFLFWYRRLPLTLRWPPPMIGMHMAGKISRCRGVSKMSDT